MYLLHFYSAQKGAYKSHCYFRKGSFLLAINIPSSVNRINLDTTRYLFTYITHTTLFDNVGLQTFYVLISSLAFTDTWDSSWNFSLITLTMNELFFHFFLPYLLPFLFPFFLLSLIHSVIQLFSLPVSQTFMQLLICEGWDDVPMTECYLHAGNHSQVVAHQRSLLYGVIKMDILGCKPRVL